MPLLEIASAAPRYDRREVTMTQGGDAMRWDAITYQTKIPFRLFLAKQRGSFHKFWSRKEQIPLL